MSREYFVQTHFEVHGIGHCSQEWVKAETAEIAMEEIKAVLRAELEKRLATIHAISREDLELEQRRKLRGMLSFVKGMASEQAYEEGKGK